MFALCGPEAIHRAGGLRQNAAGAELGRLALIACLLTLRRYPGPALFGLAVLAVTAFSGAPQSLIRYVLMVPSLFIQASRLGRSVVFDRAWTTASLLLMGLLVTLFTFDMWVA